MTAVRMMKKCRVVVVILLWGVAVQVSSTFWVPSSSSRPLGALGKPPRASTTATVVAAHPPFCRPSSSSMMLLPTTTKARTNRSKLPRTRISPLVQSPSWPLYEIGNNDHSSVAEEETSSSSSSSSSCWTREQVESYALQQGVLLSLTTLGPGYRAVARCRHDPSQILGYVEGFVRPSRLLHLDQMQVFRPVVQRARRENPHEFRGGGTVLGVGLLMGYLCLQHGQEQGCHVAEFLAINDQELQHQRLVRYYKHAGFAFVKYVGDDFMDIPDRMVWGGCGTLLRQEIPVLLESWSRLMEKSLEKDNRR